MLYINKIELAANLQDGVWVDDRPGRSIHQSGSCLSLGWASLQNVIHIVLIVDHNFLQPLDHHWALAHRQHSKNMPNNTNLVQSVNFLILHLSSAQTSKSVYKLQLWIKWIADTSILWQLGSSIQNIHNWKSFKKSALFLSPVPSHNSQRITELISMGFIIFSISLILTDLLSSD